MTEKNGQGCPYAGRCGGCQMDGVPYEDQLRIKEERVRKLLKAFGPARRIAGMRDPAG